MTELERGKNGPRGPQQTLEFGSSGAVPPRGPGGRGADNAAPGTLRRSPGAAAGMDRLAATRRFYELLEALERRIGGRRRLGNLSARNAWPERGVYFVFEPKERRARSGVGSRVVRVGTHALAAGSRSTLWRRLRQHRGTLNPPGGLHRASVLRKMVGEAAMARTPELAAPTWGKGERIPDSTLLPEQRLERLVSRRLRDMAIVFLPLEDAPGPDSLRGYVVRQTIALLSADPSTPIDPPSTFWLGYHSPRERVRRSGLWNRRDAGEPPDPRFLDVLARLVRNVGLLA